MSHTKFDASSSNLAGMALHQVTQSVFEPQSNCKEIHQSTSFFILKCQLQGVSRFNPLMLSQCDDNTKEYNDAPVNDTTSVGGAFSATRRS
ncbi:hypothetical protein EVAR_88645_1 [Eumeta japonica]|uniref:Uncharacterized protein n=1 Tax=Eumeta variegata TaxID=151549 RepID=A0A4C1WZR4_EUMVA|nr:hypothetical protein EVAR_88645_1 [Eumeta japonica]